MGLVRNAIARGERARATLPRSVCKHDAAVLGRGDQHRQLCGIAVRCPEPHPASDALETHRNAAIDQKGTAHIAIGDRRDVERL